MEGIEVSRGRSSPRPSTWWMRGLLLLLLALAIGVLLG